LLLNPEISTHSHAIDENDFYGRCYKGLREPPEAYAADTSSGPVSPDSGPACSVDAETVLQCPTIRIDAVLSDLSEEDEDAFPNHLVPWRDNPPEVIDATEEGEDPFANAKTAIRVRFEGWYDPEEDDFLYETFFLPSKSMTREECHRFTREHKRRIGFLIYRDFRALTRPITLDPTTLFGRLLQSQEVIPQHFEEIINRLQGVLGLMTQDPDVEAILSAYKAEMERYLLLSPTSVSDLSFELTDGTRSQLKDIAQMHVLGAIPLPLQKSGAGTRSLAILAILTLIMRRRGRGILALEEPETFLFPHAQRRVIDECLAVSSQLFVTTHSPYILERMPVEGVGRIDRRQDGTVSYTALSTENVKQVNLYSRRLRHSFCEALLGRAVVIVEGESDRSWLSGTSRILNRVTWNGRLCEAFELQGIAVISTEGNRDICKTGTFFLDAGLKVIAIVDRINDPEIIDDLCGASFPSIFLRQTGLEAILAEQLPVEIVRRILLEAPHSRTPLRTPVDLSGMNESLVRGTCMEMLMQNKGSYFMHEWIISLLDETILPTTLKNIVDMVLRFVTGEVAIQTCSLIH
jgi:putative ATP-dependent endonuclease of OLD family